MILGQLFTYDHPGFVMIAQTDDFRDQLRKVQIVRDEYLPQPSPVFPNRPVRVPYPWINPPPAEIPELYYAKVESNIRLLESYLPLTEEERKEAKEYYNSARTSRRPPDKRVIYDKQSYIFETSFYFEKQTQTDYVSLLEHNFLLERKCKGEDVEILGKAQMQYKGCEGSVTPVLSVANSKITKLSQLKKLKVDRLKYQLGRHKLSKVGKKKQLQKRICIHFLSDCHSKHQIANDWQPWLNPNLFTNYILYFTIYFYFWSQWLYDASYFLHIKSICSRYL